VRTSHVLQHSKHCTICFRHKAEYERQTLHWWFLLQAERQRRQEAKRKEAAAAQDQLQAIKAHSSKRVCSG
jgi:hypothetical protein